jgi:DNA polymerase-3 subunit beta
MKLSCLQQNLTDALNIVGRVVPAKSTLPVLSNVLLATDEGRLKLAATNLEMAMTVWIGARVETEGAITLPARVLSEWTSLLDRDQQIDMTLNPRNKKVQFKCGRYESNISGIDAEDFPPIPAVEEGASVLLEAPLLKDAVTQVVFAAAQDDSRPVLAGVLLKLEGSSPSADSEPPPTLNGAKGKGHRLTLAAADGFRLAVRTVDLPDAQQELNMIVPARSLAELARVLPDDEGKLVELAATPNRSQVLFKFGDIQMVSRLVEGQFPDYSRIIPQEAKTKALLGTRELLQATKAASVFARDNSMIVRLQFNPAEDQQELALGKVVVSSNSAEMGDNTGDLDASVDGEEQQVAFNGKYLREALEALNAPQVRLDVTGPASPGVVRPAGAETDGYLHVIMPMHVAK